MRILRTSKKFSGLFRKVFAVMLVGALAIGGAATVFADTAAAPESGKKVEVIDFDAETTHAGFKDGETNSLQTLFVELDFAKEMKIVDKAALLEEMNILSKAYVNAQKDGDLADGKTFVVFGAGLKPEQTDVELINDNKTLKITTKGWGAQVAGIFRAVGNWENLQSVDGETADVNVKIIIPNGISTETVKQVVATENTNASVTVKVIRPADATRGMVHWMLLKNGEPVPGNYDTGLGFNQVGATFNAHLHNYASDTAVDFANNSVNTMKPLLNYAYDIEYKEGSDEITVTAKDSQPGDILEMHIYSYLNDGSKASNKSNDTTSLKDTINNLVVKVDKSLYTQKSYAAFSDALAKAQVIAENPTYYSQADIDAANAQLLKAQEALVPATEQNEPSDKDDSQQNDSNAGQDQTGENTDNAKADDKSVSTGDDFHMGIYAAVMAAAAIAGIAACRRKHTKA